MILGMSGKNKSTQIIGNSLTNTDTLFNNREDFTKPLKGDKL
jgi:hypothetical protein